MRKRHRDQKERFFPFQERKLMARNRSSFFFFFFCHRQAEAKNFSRSDALVFKNFHSGLLLLLLLAIYKERERETALAWIRRLNENGPQRRKLPARSNSRWEGFKVGINSKTRERERERERGFIIENSKIQERNAQQKRAIIIIIKRKVTWSKWD